jgi:hypothetical protein
MKITTKVWVHCDMAGCQRQIKLDVDWLEQHQSDIIAAAEAKGWKCVNDDSRFWCHKCAEVIGSVGCQRTDSHPPHEFTNEVSGAKGVCLGVSPLIVKPVFTQQADADLAEWMYESPPVEPPETIGDVVASVNPPYPSSVLEIDEWVRSAWALKYPAWEITESSVSIGGRPDGSTTVFVRVRPILKREPEGEPSLLVKQCYIQHTHIAHRWGMDSLSGGKDRYNCPGALFDGRETTSLADLPPYQKPILAGDERPGTTVFCGKINTHGAHSWGAPDGMRYSCNGHSIASPPVRTIMWCGHSYFHPSHEWSDDGHTWQCEGRRVELIRPPTTEEMRTYLRDHYGVEDGDGVPIPAAPPVPRVKLYERVCSSCQLNPMECECEVFGG